MPSLNCYAPKHSQYVVVCFQISCSRSNGHESRHNKTCTTPTKSESASLQVLVRVLCVSLDWVGQGPTKGESDTLCLLHI